MHTHNARHKSRKNARDVYALRTAQLGMHVTLPFFFPTSQIEYNNPPI
jgi:hypothetical protein